MTCQSSADLRQSRGSNEALYTIFYPLTPFFWYTNIRVENMEVCRSDSGAVAAETLCLQLKVTSLRRKLVLSYLYPVYSPGCSIKKYVMKIMFYMDYRSGYGKASAVLAIIMRNYMGMCLTWIGVVSLF